MADPDDPCAVYVGGLSLYTDEERLKKEFSAVGGVKRVKVICDKDTNQSRGYAFITFDSPREAGAAIRELDGKTIDGRTIRVNELRRKGEARLAAPSHSHGASRGYRGERNQPRSPPRKRTPSPVRVGTRSRSQSKDRESRGKVPQEPIESTIENYETPLQLNVNELQATELVSEEEKNIHVVDQEVVVDMNADPVPMEDVAQKLPEREVDEIGDLEARRKNEEAMQVVQSDITSLQARKGHLTEKFQELEAKCNKLNQKEEKLRENVQEVKSTLGELKKSRDEKVELLKKLSGSISKLTEAEESRKKCEDEVKFLLTTISVTFEGPEPLPPLNPSENY